MNQALQHRTPSAHRLNWILGLALLLACGLLAHSHWQLRQSRLDNAQYKSALRDANRTASQILDQAIQQCPQLGGIAPDNPM